MIPFNIMYLIFYNNIILFINWYTEKYFINTKAII